MDGAGPFRCARCGFELWLPAAELPSTVLGLYDDARFPGRCLLVLREHHEDLATLAPDLAALFLQDAQVVGRVLKRVTGTDRINYAILGNAEPHLHFHLIPRYPDDPVPHRAPWSHPEPRRALAPAELERLRRRIAVEVVRELQAARPVESVREP